MWCASVIGYQRPHDLWGKMKVESKGKVLLVRLGTIKPLSLLQFSKERQIMDCAPEKLKKELEEELQLSSEDLRSHAWYHGRIPRQVRPIFVSHSGSVLMTQSDQRQEASLCQLLGSVGGMMLLQSSCSWGFTEAAGWPCRNRMLSLMGPWSDSAWPFFVCS